MQGRHRFSEVYGEFETEARERLGQRDPEDWPTLASALAIGCPIWTEDTDFFGCGVATWTSSRVELLLRPPQKQPGMHRHRIWSAPNWSGCCVPVGISTSLVESL